MALKYENRSLYVRTSQLNRESKCRAKGNKQFKHKNIKKNYYKAWINFTHTHPQKNK